MEKIKMTIPDFKKFKQEGRKFAYTTAYDYTMASIVDCQVLVSYDLLGMYNGFKPKFVKHFANIREQMVAGFNKFHEESVTGVFPDESTSFNKAVEIPKLY